MSTPKNPQMNMAPTIASTTLPDTPAHEWAEGTTSALQSKLSEAHPASKGSALLTNSGMLPNNSHGGASRDSNIPPLVSTASSASTPGFPGAYPREDAGNVTDAMREAAADIVDTAKQYLPAQEDVQHALEVAGTTAKQYLPESVGAYLPGGAQPTSLPSTEVYGNMGKSSSGAGALPGTLSETSVAKLPEERKEEGLAAAKQFGSVYAREQAWSQNQPNAPSTHTPAGAGVGDLAGSSSAHHDERISSSQRTGGVGDLPGGENETGIALLPEEKAVNIRSQQPSSTRPVVTTTNQYGGNSLSPSRLPGTGAWNETSQADSDASNIALPPTPANFAADSSLPPALPIGLASNAPTKTPSSSGDVESHKSTTAGSHGLSSIGSAHALDSDTSVKYSKVSGSPKTGPNEAHDTAMYDAAKAAGIEPKPAKIPTPQSSHPQGVVNTGEPKQKALKLCEEMNALVSKDTEDDNRMKIAVARGSHHEPHRSQGHMKESSSVSSVSSDKPSFMDKLKGEAKIISGKLAKNEEKVEEGKRLMGKV
ncbi:hypothetical protein ONZ45_g14132 [Pleurotus djamor]|nr:hypothetical protein ONZ45_g14132 [Pleurotus djamor]